MPFVKRELPSSARVDSARADRVPSVEELGSPNPDQRWTAARALGDHPETVPALAAALKVEDVPRVREAIMTALVRVGDEASVQTLLPYLRSSDAARRGAAVDALQSLPGAVTPFLAPLLQDDDADVRILAIELVRGLPAPEATLLLCSVLANETHPNVCASAVDALAEVGTPDALPVLQKCAARFAGTPFLPFAISVAIARISSARG
jgi:HEAT repeat protein